MEKQVIKETSKVEISLLVSLIVGLVWLLSHILPTEARVARHEADINNLNENLGKVLEDTNYIRGKIDQMTESK